jgi:hypothetical protein
VADKKAMKRKAAQSVNHLMQAVECVMELRDIFEKDHPTYAKLFTMIVDAIGMVIKELVNTYTQAWGYFPTDLSKWMH